MLSLYMPIEDFKQHKLGIVDRLFFRVLVEIRFSLVSESLNPDGVLI